MLLGWPWACAALALLVAPNIAAPTTAIEQAWPSFEIVSALIVGSAWLEWVSWRRRGGESTRLTAAALCAAALCAWIGAVALLWVIAAVDVAIV